MTSGDPTRLAIEWPFAAQASLRAIDRETALNILHCIDRYLSTRQGDVKKLKPPLFEFRLRCGDYRIFFRQTGDWGIAVMGVLHRRDAYR